MGAMDDLAIFSADCCHRALVALVHLGVLPPMDPTLQVILSLSLALLLTIISWAISTSSRVSTEDPGLV